MDLNKDKLDNNSINRRQFVKILTGGTTVTFVNALVTPKIYSQDLPSSPQTNINDILEKYPRTQDSIPGQFPGKVVQVINNNAIKDNQIQFNSVNLMLEKALLELTKKPNINNAWLSLVKPSDVIGLKVNPVAGAILSTSIEIVQAVIKQLTEVGIPQKNIIIWDRREFQLNEAGFNNQNFPNISILGTEYTDSNGSFYDSQGNLYGEQRIDKNWFYWADVDGKYDKDTIPYMINEGKYSYFSNICTKQIDKIINIPILKNAGASVTLAMKNLSFGSISNTGRLHKELWANTIAEVCAFPPIRDKLVLNIGDGIKGCYEGGPGANPQFITQYNTILAATDPVALDRVGYEIVLKKRIEEKIQTTDSIKGKQFLELAAKLKLGVADLDKINWLKFDIT